MRFNRVVRIKHIGMKNSLTWNSMSPKKSLQKRLQLKSVNYEPIMPWNFRINWKISSQKAPVRTSDLRLRWFRDLFAQITSRLGTSRHHRWSKVLLRRISLRVSKLNYKSDAFVAAESEISWWIWDQVSDQLERMQISLISKVWQKSSVFLLVLTSWKINSDNRDDRHK